MIIKEVHITDFGRLSGNTSLTLGPGLNVIHGPNEVGKTTLIRAIRYALTVKAKVTGAFLDEIKPRAGGHPEVRLVCEHQGATYELLKRFQGQSGTVNLKLIDTTGSIEEVSGDEAETRLRELLGVEDTKRQRKSTEHLGIWPLLWVEQGESDSDPTEHLNTGGRSRLEQDLSERTGEVLSGGGGDELLQRVEAEYEQYFTASGTESNKADSPIRRAKDRLDTAAERLSDLEARNQKYGDTLDQYARCMESMAQLEDQLPDLREKHEQAKSSYDRAEKARQRKNQLAAELQTTVLEREQVEGLVADRTKLGKRVDESEQAQQQAAEQVDPLSKSLDALQEQRGDLEHEAAVKAQVQRTHDRLKRRASLHIEILTLQDAIVAQEGRLEKAHALHKRCVEMEARIQSIKVEKNDVRQLQKLERKAHEARAALEAAAARVEVQGKQDVAVRIGSETIQLAAGEKADHLATARLEVQIADLASVVVVPGGEELADRVAAVEKADKARAAALEKHGVGSAEEASERVAEKERLSQELEGKQDLIESYAPDGIDALQTEVEAHKQRVAEAEPALAQVQEDVDDALPTEVDQARALAKELESSAATHADAATSAKQALAGHDSKIQEASTSLRLARQRLEQLVEEVKQRTGELKSHRESFGTNEELDQKLKAKKESEQAKQEEVDEAAEQLNQNDPEQAQRAVERTERAVQNTETERSTLREKKASLETLLSAGELIGLHEQLDQAKVEHEEAEQALARTRRQAVAAKLLYETLSACRSEARSRYIAPLMEEISALLTMLFPGGKIDLDEGFGLKQLNRSSSGADQFEELSGGAKEQVGVLIRLAMGLVLAGDDSLVVMLDDPMEASDDGRFDRMAAVLAHCANHLQVVMTTWNWNRYRQLGVAPDQVVDFEEVRTAANA